MNDLVRRGLYALPVAGILTAIPWFFLRLPNVDTDPEGYARGAIDAPHVIAGIIYGLGILALLFGVLALYGVLSHTRASGTAAAGMVLSVSSTALLFPIFGILILAHPVLADVYLAGHKDVSAGILPLTGGHFSNRVIAYLIAVLVIALAGAIATAFAVWQSDRLPKWAGVLFAIGFVLTTTISPFVAWAGAALLVISGIWLATSVAQEPTGPATLR